MWTSSHCACWCLWAFCLHEKRGSSNCFAPAVSCWTRSLAWSELRGAVYNLLDSATILCVQVLSWLVAAITGRPVCAGPRVIVLSRGVGGTQQRLFFRCVSQKHQLLEFSSMEELMSWW